jgi:hypothetical protein
VSIIYILAKCQFAWSETLAFSVVSCCVSTGMDHGCGWLSTAGIACLKHAMLRQEQTFHHQVLSAAYDVVLVH